MLESKHRLVKDRYLGKVRAAFTICTKNRNKLLINSVICNQLSRTLIDLTVEYNVKLIIYLIMPDHIHLIVQGESKEADLLNFINMFKQKTSYWYRKIFNKPLWQISYYDKKIRDENMLNNCIKYILKNPSKANMLNFFRQKEFYGTQTLNLSKMIREINQFS